MSFSKSLSFAIGILTYASSIQAEPTPSPHSSPAQLQPVRAPKQTLSPAFKRLNRSMHQALGAAVNHERKNLGPLIMFEAGQIKLYRGDTEVAGFPISPPITYHRLKVIGHAAFGTVIQLQRSDLGASERKQWTESVAKDLTEIMKELASFNLPSALEHSQRTLIKRTQALIRQAQYSNLLPDDSLKTYAEEVLPLMQRAFEYSARIHIDLIHQQAKKLYVLLTPQERKQVRGYFYGGRGARVGNLALQYVSWLVGENTGQESERIIFSEGISDRDQALDALAKFTTERRLAALVMNDPAGLHRDVLSEATRQYLATFPKPEVVFGLD